MEKFLESAKAKCQKFKLRCHPNLAKSIGNLPGKGFIDTSEGEMRILKVMPDGNCQFRSVGILLSGMDDDRNQSKLRALAVEEFKRIDDTELKRTVFFTHHENSCLTPQTCKHARKHVGAILHSSSRPFKKTVVNKHEFAVEMSKTKTWGNEYTIESLAKVLNVKVNVIQKDLTDGSFKRRCSFCPQGDVEVNILSYEESHYEALVPKVWNLTGESSPQSDLLPDIKSKSRRTLYSSNTKEKLVKTKRKGPSVLDFNAWYKKQKQNDDKNDDNLPTVSEKEIDDLHNEVPVSKYEKKVDLDRKKRSASNSDSDLDNKVPLMKRKKRNVSNYDSESGTDTDINNSKYEKKVDVGRKKRNGSNSNSDLDNEVPIRNRKKRNGSDSDINNKKYKDKVDLDTDSENNLDKKQTFLKESVVNVKEAIKKKQQTLPSMFFKPFKSSKKLDNECDVLLGESSPQAGHEVKEPASPTAVNDDELIKSGLKETVDKKNQSAKKTEKKRKCVVRSEWFQAHEAIKDVNGDKVNTYLRRVPLNKYLVSCNLCSHSISVEYKGFSAIQDHARGKKHLKRRVEEEKGGNLGRYLEKSYTDKVSDAEIASVRFAGVHNISFKTTMPHLVKTLKTIFPDS